MDIIRHSCTHSSRLYHSRWVDTGMGDHRRRNDHLWSWTTCLGLHQDIVNKCYVRLTGFDVIPDLIKIEHHVCLVDVSFLQPSWELSTFDESSFRVELLGWSVAFEDCDHDPEKVEPFREGIHRIHR